MYCSGVGQEGFGDVADVGLPEITIAGFICVVACGSILERDLMVVCSKIVDIGRLKNRRGIGHGDLLGDVCGRLVEETGRSYKNIVIEILGCGENR